MIELKDISVTFYQPDRQINAVKDVNLTIDKGDIYGIVGFSGAGKSTLVRVINLLQRPTSGEVIIKGENITNLKGKDLRRKRQSIGMIFQHFNLMASRTIFDNVDFSLKYSGKSKQERKEKVTELLELVGLSDKHDAYPSQLSGGQKQRVAIARALANNPDVLLMDEPFGALDAYTRIILQKELLKIWEQDKKTILFVTHSVDEAIYLADRVIFLSKNPGKIKADFRINLPRERQRSDPHYGELMDKMLSLFEEQ